ncbi:MAG: DUF2185 domain-containing protein [Chitinophagales bacterium]|nr:DUF2185 domain-containing protein [Chitinophagales bacterium]
MKKVILSTLLTTLTMFNLFGQKKSDTNNTDYKFKEDENTVCIVCDHVLCKQRPILYAAHDKEDGSWQFLCGQHDHTEANAKIISLKQATEIDSTINDLFEMPLGVGAERKTTKDKWVLFRLQD